MSSAELINCKLCFDILKEPIKLPCNNYICKAHENEFEDGKMVCILCNQIHSIPEQGWKIDDNMQSMVDHLKAIHKNIVEDKNYKELKERINIYEMK